MAEARSKSGQPAHQRENAAGKPSFHLQYFRSAIAAPEKHKRVVKGLGFTRLNQIVEREDTPSIRGMVQTVPHLVRVVDAAAAKAK